MMATEPNHIIAPLPLQRAAALRLLLADRLAGDLASFAKKAWTVLNPTRLLIWSWHDDYLCEMLTLVKAAAAAQADHQHSTTHAQVHVGDGHLSQLGVAHRARAQFSDRQLLARLEHRALGDAPLAVAVAMVPTAFRRPLPACRRPQSSGAIRQRPARADDRDLGRRDHDGPGMRHRNPRRPGQRGSSGERCRAHHG